MAGVYVRLRRCRRDLFLCLRLLQDEAVRLVDRWRLRRPPPSASRPPPPQAVEDRPAARIGLHPPLQSGRDGPRSGTEGPRTCHRCPSSDWPGTETDRGMIINDYARADFAYFGLISGLFRQAAQQDGHERAPAGEGGLALPEGEMGAVVRLVPDGGAAFGAEAPPCSVPPPHHRPTAASASACRFATASTSKPLRLSSKRRQ